MTDLIQFVLDRYGQSAALWTAESAETIRAFLQPVTEKGECIPDYVTDIGWVDGRLWLYLGRAEVQPGDCIIWIGKRFQVRSSRPYYIGNRQLYWWAVLEQGKETAV